MSESCHLNAMYQPWDGLLFEIKKDVLAVKCFVGRVNPGPPWADIPDLSSLREILQDFEAISYLSTRQRSSILNSYSVVGRVSFHDNLDEPRSNNQEHTLDPHSFGSTDI